MKLALSQIAWRSEHEEAIAQRMPSWGFYGVELVPAKLGADPFKVPDATVIACQRFWQSHGISPIAMQSLLYGRPDLQLFNPDCSRLRAYLVGIIRLASRLDVPILVFGSPKNRVRGAISLRKARAIARSFFRELGEIAAAHNVCLCLEANPPQYGCDFITTSQEALELVQEVDSPGFGLHVDCGAMFLADEPFEQLVALVPWIRHVHLSAPQLGPLGPGAIDYRAILQMLHDYEGWISLEMRSSEAPLPMVEAACQYIQGLLAERSLP